MPQIFQERGLGDRVFGKREIKNRNGIERHLDAFSRHRVCAYRHVKKRSHDDPSYESTLHLRLSCHWEKLDVVMESSPQIAPRSHVICPETVRSKQELP